MFPCFQLQPVTCVSKTQTSFQLAPYEGVMTRENRKSVSLNHPDQGSSVYQQEHKSAAQNSQKSPHPHDGYLVHPWHLQSFCEFNWWGWNRRSFTFSFVQLCMMAGMQGRNEVYTCFVLFFCLFVLFYSFASSSIYMSCMLNDLLLKGLA